VSTVVIIEYCVGYIFVIDIFSLSNGHSEIEKAASATEKATSFYCCNLPVGVVLHV